MVAAQERAGGRRAVALASTLVFHALLLLLFILWKIVTPIPPFPEVGGGGGGLAIDLGYSAEGMGDDNESMAPPPQENTPVPAAQGNEQLVTDDDPENPALPAPVKPKPNTTQPKPPTEKPKPMTDEERQRLANERMNALFNQTGKGGQGSSNTPGNEGQRDGSPNGGGTGTGGGSGTGTGTGTGTGSGPGDGGIGYDLGGRSMRFKPPINDKPGVAGRVVMDIIVDMEGNVLSAEQNLGKSTTMAHNLVQIARTTALKCKFEKRSTGPAEQRGTITFTFKVQ
jgi:colicin import membrane protein